MLHCKRLLCVLAVLLLACACSSKIDYLDNKDVKLFDVKAVEEDDFLLLHLNFKNSSSSDVNNTVYRVEWFDEDGNFLEQTSWRPVIVKGGVTVRATERSTVPGAKDYRIQISNDAS